MEFLDQKKREGKRRGFVGKFGETPFEGGRGGLVKIVWDSPRETVEYIWEYLVDI